MPSYRITPLAGPMVAGVRHNGVGSILTLTESQAKYDLMQGYIEPYVAPAPAAESKSDKKD